MLDYRMKTFLTLCITKNYTAAAKELCITQPAVTQHIKFLEGQYNTKLFYYDETRKLHLTSAGKELKNFATTISADSQHLFSSFQSQSFYLDEIKVGTVKTLGESVVPDIISSFLRKNPDTNVHLYLGESDDLLLQLQNGMIHFCFTDAQCSSNEFESHELFRSETVCICAPDHPLAGKTVDFKELNKYRLVFRENDTLSKRNLTRILRSNNQDYRAFASYIEAGSIHAMKRLVADGTGITFVYKVAVLEELASGKLKQIHINEFNSSHFFNMAWVKNSFFSEKNLEFLELCNDALKEYDL